MQNIIAIPKITTSFRIYHPPLPKVLPYDQRKYESTQGDLKDPLWFSVPQKIYTWLKQYVVIPNTEVRSVIPDVCICPHWNTSSVREETLFTVVTPTPRWVPSKQLTHNKCLIELINLQWINPVKKVLVWLRPCNGPEWPGTLSGFWHPPTRRWEKTEHFKHKNWN